MSDTLVSLRRKIAGAGDLESVVRSMKALAGASIGQYERSVAALSDYYRTVELGLVVCLRQQKVTENSRPSRADAKTVSAIVFGSDQGLVGQFNDVIAEFASSTLNPLPGEKKVWAVGERIHARLTDSGLPPLGLFAVPTSVNAITRLVGQILVESEAHLGEDGIEQLYLFHNGPRSGATYEPVSQRLLPLDQQWSLRLTHLPWPSSNLPEVIGSEEKRVLRLGIYCDAYWLWVDCRVGADPPWGKLPCNICLRPLSRIGCKIHGPVAEPMSCGCQETGGICRTCFDGFRRHLLLPREHCLTL